MSKSTKSGFVTVKCSNAKCAQTMLRRANEADAKVSHPLCAECLNAAEKAVDSVLKAAPVAEKPCMLSSQDIFDLCVEQYGKRPLKSDAEARNAWRVRYVLAKRYAKRHGFLDLGCKGIAA